MNYGRFFEFDFESSYLQKGITVFNYRWLQRKTDGKRKSPRYPVYLVFTPEVILFKLHYYEDKLKENDKDDKDGEKNKRSHYHNTIIELRLSPNFEVVDGLAESLNNTFEAKFPMKANAYLRGIIRESFDNHDCSMPGFSQLETFKPEAKDRYESEEETHFLRKLILDFMYDLEFTDVFKNVAFYDTISTKLKENFLFCALANKLRYYYYRTVICADEVAGCKIEDMTAWNKNIKYFFEQYAKAEHEWVSSILDDRSMKAFHESPWFGESYQELDQVYSTSRSESWQKHDSNVSDIPNVPDIPDIPDIPNIPSPIPIEDLKTKQAYLKRIGVTKTDSFGLTVSNLLNLIRKKSIDKDEKDGQDSYEKSVCIHCETAKAAAKWDVSHYHFIGLWKLWFGDKKTLLWSLLLVLPIVGLAGLLFYKMYTVGDGTNELLRRWSFVITIVPLILLMVALGRIARRRFRSTWGMGGVAMMMPRLIAAIVTAWFTMSMSEDLFHYFAIVNVKDEPFNHWPAMVILTLITGIFIGYESRSINPYNKWYHYLFSSVLVFAIAYTYSLVVGYLVYDFFGNAMAQNLIIEAQEKLIKEGKDPTILKLNKHPFVIQFSFFASFIGIFLQLMFQGKTVTESK